MNKRYRPSNGLKFNEAKVLPAIKLANLSTAKIERDAKMFTTKFNKAFKKLSKY